VTRIRAAVAIGVGAVLVGWGLGSTAIAAAALALLVAALAASLWRRHVAARLLVERAVPREKLVEGDTLRYRVLRSGSRLPGTYVLWESISRLGERSLPLGRTGVDVVLEEIPRGRIVLGPSTLVAADPLGLVEVVAALAATDEVLVRPRLPRLGAIHTDGSGRLRLGRGRALRHAAGTELHGVREYRAGEPMRTVHWASTARRGRLMVRELEEPTADDVAVVLDLDARADVGPPGRSSLDEAVRVAGALVVAHRDRGRLVRLVVAAAVRRTLTVRSPGDLETMLDLLAGADPRPSGTWSAQGGARPTPTILVTARAESAARTSERLDAVVLIDAPSYAGGPRHAATAPLLGLAGRGVLVSVVRAGDDLVEVLAGRALGGAADG